MLCDTMSVAHSLSITLMDRHDERQTIHMTEELPNGEFTLPGPVQFVAAALVAKISHPWQNAKTGR